ncbi:4-diphosphocytidyl-2-C-methyl-D-erythritol kinase [Phycisphaerales bacterium]|nr:4-diphosphocytidyl-2-C-methyl-D-erythritol kinase [Phycisphaerales bacterium]
MQPLTRRAYAKVNLILSVGPPEPADAPKAGWHPIASWFHAIDLWDDLTVERLPDSAPAEFPIRWAADALRPTPIDWPVEKDLAPRAHRALEALAGRALPVRVTIAKRIPTGSGLGGGSSDAAATLLALNDLFGLNLTEPTLRSIAGKIGSDAIFFTDTSANPPRPALVTGFGDGLERLARAKASLVLVVPPWPCATPAVYRAFDEVLAEKAREREIEWVTAKAARHARGQSEGRPPEAHRAKPDLVLSRIDRMKGRAGDNLFNDLALAAFRIEPRLGELVTSLSRATRSTVHVTGSGSALFVIADRPEKTLEQVRRALPIGSDARIVSLV